jgi:hypothetical protein
MASILVDADIFDKVLLCDFARHNPKIEFYFWISEGFNEWKNYTKSLSNVVVLHQQSFEIFSSSSLFKKQAEVAHHLIVQLQNSFTLSLLSYRKGFNPTWGFGLYHYSRYINYYAHNVLDFLSTHKFDFLFFRVTPHNSHDYILATVAEFLGIKVFVCESVLLPYRYALYQGFGRNRSLINFKKNVDDEDIHLAKLLNEKYLHINSGSYDDAMPEYEKVRTGKGYFKFFNPFRELRNYYKRPWAIVHKYRCFNFYQANAIKSYPENKKYILFFLHYQPECSTVPEGFGFEEAYNCIVELRKYLPVDIQICVKEHPSTFTYYCDFRVRNIKFYKDILSLPNTVFVNLHLDNFKLIDRSIFVSTVTGTVAIQAAMRNIPVFRFGRNSVDFNGFTQYNSINELKDFIDNAINFRFQQVRRDCIAKMEEVIEYSYGPVCNNVDNFNFYDTFTISDPIHLKLLQKAIDEYISAY